MLVHADEKLRADLGSPMVAALTEKRLEGDPCLWWRKASLEGSEGSVPLMTESVRGMIPYSADAPPSLAAASAGRFSLAEVDRSYIRIYPHCVGFAYVAQADAAQRG
jgi:hypothetical protein